MWKFLQSRPWWLLTGGLFLVLAGWGIYRLWFTKTPAPQLITAAVVRGDLEDAVLASGTIQASRLVNVGSQASGQVKKLYVKLGDVVQVGQKIADIDDTTQQNTLKDAQAALASARAQKTAKQATLAKAQAEFARQKYMHERDAASKADYQSAQQALTAAQADIRVADALINQYDVRARTAQANVGYTRITAPTAGTVVAIVADEGQTVNANQTAPTIVKVAQLDSMTIQAQISEADVPRVRPGLPAWFTILGEPDHQYSATLSRIEPGPIDMKTYDGTSPSSSNAIYYNGLLDAPNPDGKLRIAMTAQVSIVLDQAKNALLIPSGALIQHSGRRGAEAASGASAPRQGAPTDDSPGRGRLYTVRVAKSEKGNETVEERPVRIGLNNRVQAQVLEGLQEGEQIVIGDAAGAGAGGSTRRIPGIRMF